MSDDRLERPFAEAAGEYHRPPATPREEMWRHIEAVRAAQRRRGRALRSGMRWGAGIAAALVLGLAIGRWTAGAGAGRTPPAAAGRSAGAATPLAYEIAAGQHLTSAEALLTRFRTETGAGRQPGTFAAQARDLLATTRLMLDSPAANDPRLRGLLEDLELVLAEIAQLPASGDREDVQLINQGMDHRGVLLRLRTAIPAGPGPVRTQGAS